MVDNMVKEYDNLRNEINQKIELHNTLLTFTITTTVAVLTFALSQDMTILYLVPFCIIIPMSMRIAYYRAVMAKISAYMIEFLEKDLDGIKWETRNAELINLQLKNKSNDIYNFTTLRYYECLSLAVICYIFYIVDFIKDKEISIFVFINIVWPFSLVVLEALITKRINSFDKERQKWREHWSKLKVSAL